MKTRLMALWLAAAPILSSAMALAQEAPAPTVKHLPGDAPKRVLFIANSLIYYSGGLQTHVHRLDSADKNPFNLKDGYKSVHITGANLANYPIEFLTTPGNLGPKEPYELFVLGGNSQDAATDEGRARYRQKVKEFDDAIKSRAGRTALLWLPAFAPNSPLGASDLGKKTEDMMLAVGNEVGALIIPLAPAFKEAYHRRPDLKLQVGYDANHPTLVGQYLSACVVYASIYGRSPVGNSYDYFGALDPETRLFVQTIAEETVKKFYGR